MNEPRQRERLRRIGALWKPRPGSKSKGSGAITVNGLRQKFVILVNDRKTAGSAQPDYLLMTADEPEPDPYAQRGPASAPGRQRVEPEPIEADEDIAF
jgi:hypothetical protein